MPAPPASHRAAERATAPGPPSGWMWPAVAVLALVLGLAGGVAGSVVYNQTSDDGSATDGTAPATG